MAWSPFLAAWLGLGMVSVALLNFSQHFQTLIPAWLVLPRTPFALTLALGLALLYWAFRRGPEVAAGDLSPAAGRFWLAVILAVGLFLRMYRPDLPCSDFWFDHLIVTSDIRNLLDLTARPVLFKFGAREPFFPYFTALLWVLLPKATGVEIVRWSSTLIDVATLWCFYLLGKEIAGRKLGLVLAAIGAADKTMILLCIFGFGNNTAVLDTALALLFFFRFVHKPDLRHFAQWGLALGFSAYAYVPARLWAPAMVGMAFFWLLGRVEERERGFKPLAAAAVFALFWCLLFLRQNLFLPKAAETQAGLSAILAVLLGWAGWAAWETWRKSADPFFGPKLSGWILGSTLALGLMWPIWCQDNYAAHTTDLSIFNHPYTAGPYLASVFNSLMDNIRICLLDLFRYSEDNMMFPAGSPFFEFFEEVAVFAGLAFIAARFAWPAFFMLLMALVGLIPAVVSHYLYTGRLIGSEAPFLAIAALGILAFWRRFLPPTKGKTGRILGVLILLAAWGGDLGNEVHILDGWFGNPGNQAFISRQAGIDCKDHRVYIALFDPCFADGCQLVLNDGRGVFWLDNASNPIFTPAQGTPRDVVVLLAVKDQALQERIKREFPQAQWRAFDRKESCYGSGTYMWRVLIPYNQIPAMPASGPAKTLFYTRPAPPDGWWHRRVYAATYGVPAYGINRGILAWEDWAPSLSAPLTTKTGETAWFQGPLQADRPGKYDLSARAYNYIILSLDGKKIWDSRPDLGSYKDLSKSLYLSAGPHRVDYQTYFPVDNQVPPVHVRCESDGKEFMLGAAPSPAPAGP